MTISSPAFQRLQDGIQRVDDLRVRGPVNAALAWLSGDLVTQLNAHFNAISQSVSTQISDRLSVYNTTLPAFRAHKNGTDQTSISAGSVPITFGTEAFDVGGHYASDAWTPPAGTYRITAQVRFNALNAVDNELLTIILTKNGAANAQHTQPRAGTSVQSLGITTTVDANGTDSFAVVAAKAGAGIGTVEGAAIITFFCGERI